MRHSPYGIRLQDPGEIYGPSARLIINKNCYSTGSRNNNYNHDSDDKVSGPFGPAALPSEVKTAFVKIHFCASSARLENNMRV